MSSIDGILNPQFTVCHGFSTIQLRSSEVLVRGPSRLIQVFSSNETREIFGIGPSILW